MIKSLNQARPILPKSSIGHFGLEQERDDLIHAGFFAHAAGCVAVIPIMSDHLNELEAEAMEIAGNRKL